MSIAAPVLFRSAEFSEDRGRRFLLLRSWRGSDVPRYLNLIGLNPSDADETRDDMTIRKGCGFARRWGYNGIMMTNLSAVVSTDPWKLPAWAGVDHENLARVKEASLGSDLVLAAWGSVPRSIARRISLPELIWQVRSISARPLFCIGETRDGSPRHPSRCAYTDRPVAWRDAI